jgi:hypothetical protein
MRYIPEDKTVEGMVHSLNNVEILGKCFSVCAMFPILFGQKKIAFDGF